MSDQTQNNASEDFAALLEQSFVDAPVLKKGEQIEGTITAITGSNIFIGIGGKQDAIADVEEYKENGNLNYKVGDKLKGYIVNLTESEITVSTSLNSSVAGKSALKDAFVQKIPVTGKISSAIKAGFTVNVLGSRAFCPISQFDLHFIEEPAQYVGQSFTFEIIEFAENGRNVVISRKILLQKEREELRKKTMETLEVGGTIKAVVKRLASFGAFMDLGGVDALLPISQISWSRIEKVADAVEVGQELTVKVMSIEGNKISVSLKVLTDHPFDLAVKELEVGQIVSCRIVRNESFGSFAEITSGVEGLIPISQMARGRRIARPSEVVNVGDLVEAQILTIDAAKRKISLSLKALQPDPWENIEDYYAEGEVYKGIIENVVEFGTFVRLMDGVTGLLPASKMNIAGIKLSHTDIGNEIELRIAMIKLDEKKISLEPIEMPEAPVREEREDRQERRDRRPRRKKEDTEWKQYASSKNEVPEDNPFMKL